MYGTRPVVSTFRTLKYQSSPRGSVFAPFPSPQSFFFRTVCATDRCEAQSTEPGDSAPRLEPRTTERPEGVETRGVAMRGTAH